jgi:low affinity Fe/Cu permease
VDSYVAKSLATLQAIGEYLMNDFFRRFSQNVSALLGTPPAFIIAVLVIILWGICGPIFHFSDTWQLVINTSTTIITFLMVFLIQNTQNRDARAIHLKLDELIRTTKDARNTMVDIEDLTDEELNDLAKEFQIVRERARQIRAQREHREKG